MKSVAMPKSANGFDGAKFAKRYSVDTLNGDFYIEDGLLFYPDSLPDPASIVLEACDSAPAKPAAAIASIKAGTGTAGDVLAVLRYLALTGRV